MDISVEEFKYIENEDMVKRLFIKFYNWITHPYRIRRLGGFLVARQTFLFRKHFYQKRLRELSKKQSYFLSQKKKPIILFSSCENSLHGGDLKYNGGMKVYNLWAKLLRAHGYEAYIVTYNGNYHPWLIEHQPVISLATARQLKEGGRFIKFVTAWLGSKTFIDLADQIYFYETEVAQTSTVQNFILKKLIKSKIHILATNSRVHQGWYRAKFNIGPFLIPEWSDEEYWFPNPEQREVGLVGYMKESPNSEKEIKEINTYAHQRGINLRFIEIKGNEREVRDTMQRCDFYLGLNPGKDLFRSEGCPRSQQEAMHAGCVVIAYDVLGNREYLIDGYTGFLAPLKKPQILAEHLTNLMSNPDLKEQIRASSINLVSRAFTSYGRWPLLSQFLELENNLGQSQFTLKRSDLELYLRAPAYIADEEIPVFSQYASKAKERLVEIGAAYGASTILMLISATKTAIIHSIDPFVNDSMGGFQASADECRRNVLGALKKMKMPEVITRWHLHTQPSYKLAPSWRYPIDFLYIDGDHNYKAVSQDFKNWFPFVRKGGVILLHDSRRESKALEGEYARGWPGPTRLAQELKKRNDLELIGEVFSLTIWKKSK